MSSLIVKTMVKNPSEPDKLDTFYRVDCGFGKWSIGVDENCQVVICFNRIPIDGTICLGDCSYEEMKAIGELFLALSKNQTP